MIAVDVSEAHLDIARRELTARGVSNVEFRLLGRQDELAMLDSADFFYSVIVLQHNPPPIIVEILQQTLRWLSHGGTAFFQVPTYGFNYELELRPVPRGGPAGRRRRGNACRTAKRHVRAGGGARSRAGRRCSPTACAGIPFGCRSTFLLAKPGVVAADPGKSGPIRDVPRRDC